MKPKLLFPGHVLYGAADDGNGATGVIQFASKPLGVGKEFARVVVQNLTMDGNWDAQDYIGAHHPRGYKNQPMSVSARTGRIREVIVRNYGSHGLAPWSAYDSASGVECFPLNVGTTDVGQELEDGDPRVFGVPVKRLNGQVKRNADRFPPDFMFRLNREAAEAALRPRSQIATLKHGTNLKYLPHAFTENGAVMAANVLDSPEAVRMSVFVVRAFVKMRELLGGIRELAKQLAQLEKKLTDRLDVHETAIVEVLQRIMEILDPPPPPPEPPKRQMGFHTRRDDEQGHTYLGDPENRAQVYPDYVRVCKSFNVPAEQVMFKRDLKAALQRMLDSKTAYVLNVMTPYAEHVLPFIPAGRTVADMKY